MQKFYFFFYNLKNKLSFYYSRITFLGHLSLTHLEFYTRTKKITEDQTKQSDTEMWMWKEIFQAISTHPSLKIDPANCPSIEELTTADSLFVQAAFQGDLSQVIIL